MIGNNRIASFRDIGLGLIIRDWIRSDIRSRSAPKIGYMGCPDPNPVSKNLGSVQTESGYEYLNF